MGLGVKSSFSTGELDPALHERTNLSKYKSALATARNVIITKTGSLMDRIARKYLVATKTAGSQVLGYSPPGSGYFLEWGNLYVRIYTFNTDGEATQVYDLAHPLTEADLPNIRFETSGVYVYIFCTGKNVQKLDYINGAFVSSSDIFKIPSAPVFPTVTAAGAPTGYLVDYLFTYVKLGEESLGVEVLSGAVYKLPIAAGQSNALEYQVATIPAGITEGRIYRRPSGGGAYGYIGSTTDITLSGGSTHIKYTDVGSAADYSKGPPASVLPGAADPLSLKSPVGAIYQQRLVLASSLNLESMVASRPGYQNNFYRDFPLVSDSALLFKSGTSGYAKVRHLLDADGFVAFTSAGIFLHLGEISPTNLAMSKKGKWKIKSDVPPLALPGGVFFVDEATNTIRNLVWSTELTSYNGEEVSIYSNHIFRQKAVRSWAFHEGAFPLLWVSFTDGTFATFTYEFDQEMRAWTRHDGENFYVEQVVGTEIADQTIFLMSSSLPDNGTGSTRRHWEITVPRQVRAVDLATDPEAVMGVAAVAMDHMFSWKHLVLDDLIDDTMTMTAVSPGTEPDPDYIEGQITVSVVNDAIFLNVAGGAGEVGGVLRWFNPDDQTYIDLEIITHTNNNAIVVQPSEPFPKFKSDGSTNLTNTRLYVTTTQIDVSGFSFGTRELSLVVDGAVVASPNNDIENYGSFNPSGGGILPNGMRGAIIHVGYPFTSDWETLDIDTIEQAPTLIESLTVNKLYIKVNESRGLYLGNYFPDDDKVGPDVSTTSPKPGMQDIDQYIIDYSAPVDVLGNTYKHPVTERKELTLPGDWRSQGKVFGRQVDPVHFEILSIIPDVEILKRSDRE
jgi:hypothetical protein